MAKFQRVKLASFFVFAISLVSVISIFAVKDTATRSPQSFNPKDHHHSRELSQINTFTKPNGSLHIRIEALNEKARNGELLLQAVITAPRPLTNAIDFTWVVPDSIEVLSGHLQGSINTSSDNGPWVTTLSLVNPETWENPIVFSANTLISGRRSGNAAAFKPDQKDLDSHPGSQKIQSEPQALPEKIFF